MPEFNRNVILEKIKHREFVLGEPIFDVKGYGEKSALLISLGVLSLTPISEEQMRAISMLNALKIFEIAPVANIEMTDGKGNVHIVGGELYDLKPLSKEDDEDIHIEADFNTRYHKAFYETQNIGYIPPEFEDLGRNPVTNDFHLSLNASIIPALAELFTRRSISVSPMALEPSSFVPEFTFANILESMAERISTLSSRNSFLAPLDR
mgnify:FL=1